MTDHPEFIGLIEMLNNSAKVEPHGDAERWRRYWARVFSQPGTLNINSLDPDDPRGIEDVIDLDRERAIRDGELIEKPSGEQP